MRYPQLHDKDWLAGQIINRTQREIAAEIGCAAPSVSIACKRLGIEVPHRSTYRYNPDKGKAVSEGLKKRYPNGRRGPEHPNWKGGRHVMKNLGYVQVQRSGVLKYEHRWIMEQALGRELLPEESVHHINGVRDDNRLENLELWSKSHPSGQRVDDKIEWATTFLKLYAPERLLETWQQG